MDELDACRVLVKRLREQVEFYLPAPTNGYGYAAPVDAQSAVPLKRLARIAQAVALLMDAELKLAALEAAQPPVEPFVEQATS